MVTVLDSGIREQNALTLPFPTQELIDTVKAV